MCTGKFIFPDKSIGVVQVSLILPSFQDRFGMSTTYFTFAAIGAIALVTIYLTVPGRVLWQGLHRVLCSASYALSKDRLCLICRTRLLTAVLVNAETKGKTLEEIEAIFTGEGKSE